ncbi:MAG: PRD domain-containing protein [Fusobacteriaceae bacterium]
MRLQFRVENLNTSGIINDSTKNVVLEVISMFENKYEIILSEENGIMMITHLCKAIMRVKNNDPVKNIDGEVFKETLESEHFEKANIIYEELQKILDIVLPEDEKKYILVNICVILEYIRIHNRKR